MKKTASYIILMLIFTLTLKGQTHEELREGKVSYITSQNIYVGFITTQGINVGDQIYIKKGEVMIPVIMIKQMSTRSCIGTLIGQQQLAVSDDVYVKIPLKENVATETEMRLSKDTVVTKELPKVKKVKIDDKKQNINGRIAAASYINLLNNSFLNQRYRYTFSIDAKNIGNSKLSAESYINLTHRKNARLPIEFAFPDDFKVYTLSLQYQFNDKTKLTVGRKISNKLANIGAVDGLHFETWFKNFSVGAVAGFRPNQLNYSLDFNLLEYGVFVAHQQIIGKGSIQSSLAVFEQRNNTQTDRRFVYFQHSNSLVKRLNLFLSFEMDLYQRRNGVAANVLNFTSLYTSINYQITKNLSASLSYDARKNVMYYETFKDYADSLLESATRQGYRVRVNYRPIKYLSLGTTAGYQFRVGDPKVTKNASAFITYGKIPYINTGISLSANYLQTSYVNGPTYRGRIYRDFFKGKLYGELSYRYVDYQFVNSVNILKQHVAGIDASWQFPHNLIFSVNYESSFDSAENYSSVYANLIKRF